MPVTFWGLFLTFSVIYVAAIYITRQLASVVEEDAIMFENWGSITRSMFTLFQIATGDSWASGIVRPVLKYDRNLVVFFLIFVCLTQFAVLNVVVAVIVENVLKEALKTDEEILKQVESEHEIVMHDLFDIFSRMDIDASGGVTRDEFMQGLRDGTIQTKLHKAEISFVGAEDIFDILDADGSGSIRLEEFIDGCLKSRGPAKAKELFEVNCNVHHCLRHLVLINEKQESSLAFEADVRRILDVLVNQTANNGPSSMPQSDFKQLLWRRVESEATGVIKNTAQAILQDVMQHFTRVHASLTDMDWSNTCFDDVGELLLGLDSHLTQIENCLDARSRFTL
eukprot:gnl/MRDRNA2_/MRDRNA2_147354_c0_seq1.p1 gnl/MRDRNA2_/MRDRNA2_147354_c0~~gnl/MRDRNA2_/MRDRNA2_147354_c0_seq1.p1  ORF type:complete len:360 (+),score=60.02 gnl/MRDRNA2_/MRDRNA2_147354_c0_seq1:66-1082(+)